MKDWMDFYEELNNISEESVNIDVDFQDWDLDVRKDKCIVYFWESGRGAMLRADISGVDCATADWDVSYSPSENEYVDNIVVAHRDAHYSIDDVQFPDFEIDKIVFMEISDDGQNWDPIRDLTDAEAKDMFGYTDAEIKQIKSEIEKYVDKEIYDWVREDVLDDRYIYAPNGLTDPATYRYWGKDY